MKRSAPGVSPEEELAFWQSRIESSEAIDDVEGVLIYRAALARRALILNSVEEQNETE